MSSRSRKSRRQASRNAYESLEQKRLLAGDVIVFAHDSSIYIRGDRADNNVEVLVNDDGDIEVSGLNDTTINGESGPFVFDTQNGNLGKNLVSNLGRGNDRLFVEGLNIGGRATIHGGRGDDAIGFYQTNTGGDLFIQTFTGDDSISVDEVNVGKRLVLFSLQGDDAIGVDETNVEGLTLVSTGSGSDDLALRDSVHNDTAYLFTNGGDDFVGIDNLTVNGGTALLTGNGTDDVFINDSSFNDWTYASGGWGADNLELNGENSFARDPRVVSFEGTDVAGGMLQTDKVFEDLIVDGARLGTIVELAALTPELSTLVGALQATGLDSALTADGPFTVFAPLNSAFADISEVVEGLSAEQLADVLRFHVASGAIFADQLVTLDNVDTLLGDSSTVDLSSGEVVLNGNATLAATNIRAKNGVIHLLNDVLVPAT